MLDLCHRYCAGQWRDIYWPSTRTMKTQWLRRYENCTQRQQKQLFQLELMLSQWPHRRRDMSRATLSWLVTANEDAAASELKHYGQNGHDPHRRKHRFCRGRPLRAWADYSQQSVQGRKVVPVKFLSSFREKCHDPPLAHAHSSAGWVFPNPLLGLFPLNECTEIIGWVTVAVHQL